MRRGVTSSEPAVEEEEVEYALKSPRFDANAGVPGGQLGGGSWRHGDPRLHTARVQAMMAKVVDGVTGRVQETYSFGGLTTGGYGRLHSTQDSQGLRGEVRRARRGETAPPPRATRTSTS